MTKKREITFTIVRSLLAILIALAVAMVLVFISVEGDDFASKMAGTMEAMRQLLLGPLFRGSGFDAKRLCDILATMIPITFTGLAVCIMFSANQFNMGAEGGILLGAFIAAMVGIYMPLPPFIHAVAAVLIGGAAVGLMMLLPAVLKAKLDVSEMVCSLMLNYIILYIIKFLMNTYLADKSKGQIQSYDFLSTANIAPIVNNSIFTSTKLTWGFPVAMVTVALCGLFLYRTRWGYTIRMIGINQDFARYSGMKVGLMVVMSQVIGGFLAGAGGGVEMLGRYSYFNWKSLPGYGWTGITIAILAGNNPWFVPLAAFFMAYMQKGCDLMATYVGVPAQLISIVQGVIFLFFAAEQFLSRYRQSLVVKTAKEEMETAPQLDIAQRNAEEKAKSLLGKNASEVKTDGLKDRSELEVKNGSDAMETAPRLDIAQRNAEEKAKSLLGKNALEVKKDGLKDQPEAKAKNGSDAMEIPPRLDIASKNTEEKAKSLLGKNASEVKKDGLKDQSESKEKNSSDANMENGKGGN